jgi:hypothetical protein
MASEQLSVPGNQLADPRYQFLIKSESKQLRPIVPQLITPQITAHYN